MRERRERIHHQVLLFLIVPGGCVLGRKSGGVGNLRAKDTGLVETLETPGRGM